MQLKEQKIPAGYKQTEIGVIPDDWDVSPVEGIVDKYIDYRGRTPKKLGMDWGGGNILALSANNVQMGKINAEKEAYWGSLDLYKKWMVQGECKMGDVLMTMEAPLGNVTQIPDNKKYILSQRVILIKPNRKISKDFLAKLLVGPYFQAELLKNASGSTAQGIQRQRLDKIDIYFPNSIDEQAAIADALSDIDALIEKLEKLIEKKKLTKQGAMQELLTGKRRLPGFSGEWKYNKLNFIIKKISTGLNPRKNFVLGEGNNYYVTIKNFRCGKIYLDDKCDKISDNALALINKRSNLEIGDILFSSIGTKASVYLLGEKPKNWNINESVFSIKPNKNIIYSYFLYYLLLADWIFNKLANDATGSTFQSIKKSQLRNLDLYYPPTLEEQKKIALVIADIDSEIEKMELRLVKYQAIKQGMIQVLLTGKIRLINK